MREAIAEQAWCRDWLAKNGHDHKDARLARMGASDWMAEEILETQTRDEIYRSFLHSKRFHAESCGFIPTAINPYAFDWQRPVINYACRKGKAALWEGCGLGKSLQELEWSWQVHLHTGGDILLLTPLAVAEQMKEEAEKFGIRAKVCRSQSECEPGINITNYEMLPHFDPSRFVGVVLDESSILKDYSSATRNQLTESFRKTPYRLACSATPAPNDYMELATHAEFLGVMTRAEMLAMFFVHDGGDTSKWRLKKHAVSEFWKWVASWAVMIQMPSDIGFPDDGYILPPLRRHQVTVKSEADGTLFPCEAKTLMDRRSARRSSLTERASIAADTANGDSNQWLIWCDLNSESELLAKSIDGAVEVKGSDSRQHKIDSLRGFAHGDIRVLVSKPSIFGFGANLQNCRKMAFVGLSDSFEQVYQAERRCWRFGQKNPVDVYVITSEAEGAVVRNIERKQSEYEAMSREMVKHMKDAMALELGATKTVRAEYDPQEEMEIPSWVKEHR
jgi:hypothetical protein